MAFALTTLLSFIGYFLTIVLLEILAGSVGAVARFRSEQWVEHGLPVGIGFLVFALLFFNAKAQLWADEAVTEVRRVVWPSRKDVVAMTTVCCVMVVVAGNKLLL